MMKILFPLLVLLSTSALGFGYSSCDLDSIMDEVKSCFPKKECPECKDPVCPEPKCPEIPPFPECPEPKDESKCEQAAQKCEQTAQKGAESAQKCEEKQEAREQKCEQSKQVCEQAQEDTERVEEELEAVAEEVMKLEDERDQAEKKALELEKALNDEKRVRSEAEKKVSELEKVLNDMKQDKEGDPEDPDTSGPIPDPETDPGLVLKDLLNEINKEREAAKVGKLYISTRLQCASDMHSEDMGKTKKCSHAGSDKSSPWSRAEKCGTKAKGEIIACGQNTPKKAVEGWMNSPPHKKIMLEGKFKSVGLSMTNNYWTAIFGY